MVLVFSLVLSGVVTTDAAGKIALNKSKVTIDVGKTVKLTLKNAAASKITWTSTDDSVAKVNKKGKVKGKSAGRAVVKATFKKKTYKCRVTVNDPSVTKTGDITILYTSDVHCGIDQGFGYAGLYEIRKTLETKGVSTLLVDDGDAIQGDVIGTLTDGKAIVDIMNTMGYDVAIPGNHEFDYGMDNFLSLVKEADYDYISVNFTKNGKRVFKPYVIKKIAGKKIAFVGVTTPYTITTSTPKYFQDDKGNYIYGFMNGDNGNELYNALQECIDSARDEGADYVIAMAHMGNEGECKPYTYEDIITHVSGLDALLDGHSHDTDQVKVKDKDGKEVIRGGCGTKMAHIGYLNISADGALSAGLYDWSCDTSAPGLFGFDNAAAKKVAEVKGVLGEELQTVVGKTEYDLVINDPKTITDSGDPIRIIRRAETNLGDLCADAAREEMGADIAIVNGGGIRAEIPAGDITVEQIIKVHPYNNELNLIEATGQQILDALEWGARVTPEENGGFLQVSGLTYEIHTNVKTSVKTDENNMFAGVSGEYRVKNVKVGGEALDLKKTYKLAGTNYILHDHGDGFTMFDDCTVITKGSKIDNRVLIDYIEKSLGGVISKDYSDPYGSGRITAVEK